MNIDQALNNLQFAPSSVVQAAEKLVELKKTKDPWTVIEKAVQIWKSLHEDEWQSFLVKVDMDKETGKVTNVGSSRFSNVSRYGGGMLRHTLDIPERVVFMIRKLYTAEELPMDQDFYNEWAKRFPSMVVSEKIS